jgi:pimeloyl-ACP methyl ester carboxylesterase
VLFTMSTPIPSWPGEMISVGDLELFVRTAPATVEPADRAVFVHGLGGSATNWTDLMSLLSDVVDGAALDLPGFGYSPPPADRDYSIDAHAKAVIRFIEARDRGPVHLFGNSLGGAVATRVAALRPRSVRTLTLVSPALPDLRLRFAPARILASSLPGLGPWVLGRIGLLPPERRVQATLDICYADPTRVHADRLMDAVAEVRRRDELGYADEVLLGSTRAIVNEYLRRSLWRDAKRVTAPTLLIYGRHDRLVDSRNAARAARQFRGSRVVVLPDVGHVAQLEKPEVVAREFRMLLDDVSTASARSES